RLLRRQQATLLITGQLPQLVAIDLEREGILALEFAGVEQRRRQHHSRDERQHAGDDPEQDHARSSGPSCSSRTTRLCSSTLSSRTRAGSCARRRKNTATPIAASTRIANGPIHRT